MDHRVPAIGAAVSIVAAIVALISFVFLNESFEGPSVTGQVTDPYELTATFDDVENLPTKTSVLTRGVGVGKVHEVYYNPDQVSGTVTFSVEDEFRPIYKNATARIGERTILGDAFLDLDRGNEAAGELESGGEVTALPSVDFDEAFDFLDEKGRKHLSSVIETINEGAGAQPANGERLNATIGGITRTLDELNRLTLALQGQEQNIARLISGSNVVLGELAQRESSVRTIVGSGRTTLDALASNTAGLEQGIAELPGLLDAGRSSLRESRPLLTEARPLVADLRSIVPDLKPVFKQAGPLARDASSVIEGLKPLRIGTTQLLTKTEQALILALPVIDKLEPGVRNLVTMLGFFAPRINGVSSFFSNWSAAFSHGDANGKWARFNFNLVPGELVGGSQPGTCQPEDDIPFNSGVCENAYPKINDALDNEPYEQGDYKRLLPYEIPPRPSP